MEGVKYLFYWSFHYYFASLIQKDGGTGPVDVLATLIHSAERVRC
jgi:hypothetical protein